MNYRPTRAQVDLSALTANLTKLRQLNGSHFFCPMIKANAYGHGAVKIMECLGQNQVRDVGVALIEEAIEIRDAGFSQQNILVFGPFDARGAKAVVEHRLTPVLSRMDQLQNLAACLGPDESLNVHVKFNTGMNRLGFAIADAPKLRDFFAQHKKLQLRGICTHLAVGEDVADPGGRTAEQSARFRRAVELMGQLSGVQMHIYNSAGFLYGHSAGQVRGGFRPGISLYGAGTFPIDVAPVMRLRSELVMVHHLQKGEFVSYGARWTAKKPSVIGVVPVGYADGLHRSLSRGGEMLYRGQRVPIAGTVCMDYVMLDLTQAVATETAHVGEEVVVFGTQGDATLSAAELAAKIDTISYEILTSVSARVPREYI